MRLLSYFCQSLLHVLQIDYKTIRVIFPERAECVNKTGKENDVTQKRKDENTGLSTREAIFVRYSQNRSWSDV